MAAAAFLPDMRRNHDCNVIDRSLDLNTILCDLVAMQSKQAKWVRFVVAVFVTLSLAFLPILSQQAMAGHHVKSEVKLDATVGSQEHASGSCAKKSDTQSSDMQMNCCDMNCSTIAAFEATAVLAVQLQVAGYFEIDAEQLTSRMTFGLMRPPRT